MTDTYVVDQPAGLGDIFFVQKIAAHYVDRGYRVYHPVTRPMWDNGARQVKSRAQLGHDLHIPSDHIRLDLSNQPRQTQYDVMQSKYTGLGLDWSDWADFFHFARDPETEDALFERLGLGTGVPYILLNVNYSLGQWAKTMRGPRRLIPDGWDGRVVDMHLTGSVFDWCKVMENAQEFHSVDTCIQYITEKLELQATRLTVHPRHYARTKNAVGSLWKKQPWEWIDYERDDWRDLAPQEAE